MSATRLCFKVFKDFKDSKVNKVIKPDNGNHFHYQVFCYLCRMEKNFAHVFEQRVAERLRGAVSIGVALSGGADSVALLLAIHGSLCADRDVRLVGLHCNFGLRGDESDGDEDFCRRLCRRLDVELRLVRFDVAAASRPHESVEMACRRLRYEWFEQQASESALDVVAIAHHREDAVETALINMLRGTGPRGMRGMDVRRGIYVRPMLSFSRGDIECYLACKGVGYRTDSTNLSDDYRRNALRNTILPAIRQAFPAADAGIGVTMAAMCSSDALLNEYVGKLVQECSEVAPEACLDVVKLLGRTSEPAAALYLSVPKIFGCRLTTEASADCVRASAGSPGSRLFEATDGTVLELFAGRLMRYAAPSATSMPLSEAEGKLVATETFARGSVDIRGDGEAGRKRAYFDASLLDSGRKLMLRHWREGDRMRPFGMRGTRKVSDIFSDFHMSASQKNSVWLLTASDGSADEVLWIAGVRSSALYSVGDYCERVLRISLL